MGGERGGRRVRRGQPPPPLDPLSLPPRHGPLCFRHAHVLLRTSIHRTTSPWTPRCTSPPHASITAWLGHHCQGEQGYRARERTRSPSADEHIPGREIEGEGPSAGEHTGRGGVGHEAEWGWAVMAPMEVEAAALGRSSQLWRGKTTIGRRQRQTTDDDRAATRGGGV